jgi:hypothetical protein
VRAMDAKLDQIADVVDDVSRVSIYRGSPVCWCIIYACACEIADVVDDVSRVSRAAGLCIGVTRNTLSLLATLCSANGTRLLTWWVTSAG